MILTENKPRFDFDADNVKDAQTYIENRSRQLLRLGYQLQKIEWNPYGVEGFFKKDGKIYQAIYILKQHRGKGHYKSLVKHTIVTTIDCNIGDYLAKNEIPYVMEKSIPFIEYKIIADHYGNGKANRSQVPFMNHIDEGLAILEWIGASELAKRAYCLHPIFQSDKDLMENFDKYKIDSDVMLRVMEYRSVANEYLSNRKINSLADIRVSPLTDVNLMLVADKIQNSKDFDLYHYGKHPRSLELSEYFRNWLNKLAISQKEYQYFKTKLS